LFAKTESQPPRPNPNLKEKITTAAATLGATAAHWLQHPRKTTWTFIFFIMGTLTMKAQMAVDLWLRGSVKQQRLHCH
jgi:hypothetical protein